MTEVAALSEANGEPPTPGNLDGELLHENLCRHHIPFNKDKLKVAIGLGIAFINDLGLFDGGERETYEACIEAGKPPSCLACIQAATCQEAIPPLLEAAHCLVELLILVRKDLNKLYDLHMRVSACSVLLGVTVFAVATIVEESNSCGTASCFVLEGTALACYVLALNCGMRLAFIYGIRKIQTAVEGDILRSGWERELHTRTRLDLKPGLRRSLLRFSHNEAKLFWRELKGWFRKEFLAPAKPKT
ncbi:hypothetical protein APUTEX25_000660 [Auxenochlorella protothecoides]|uniref:Uncharacterized protein n=1 Tax=Auxenochlorella protothecoides TaxID=3075 RepID=A0A3M7KRQ2_AUXPR|nr:hypothetical protein APUTEX25_000660 [Auxenochlorella protothecoides]|eukprot:RMZ52385.1 hypothetical protein APUTEX25_000660 [Auxenochlorella protothecoides]